MTAYTITIQHEVPGAPDLFCGERRIEAEGADEAARLYLREVLPEYQANGRLYDPDSQLATENEGPTALWISAEEDGIEVSCVQPVAPTEAALASSEGRAPLPESDETDRAIFFAIALREGWVRKAN